MPHLITGRTGADVYHQVLKKIDQLGRPRTSRDGDVIELTDVMIALDGPDHALPFNCGRGVDPRIAAAEALQLIGGFSDPARMCEIAPQFKRYREDLPISGTPWFHGAYGNRVAAHGQLASVVNRLKRAPDTRQAVITIWDPEVDTEEGHLDYPCTIALGFSMSQTLGDPPRDVLNMRVTMRSNDAWLGLPYDMFQFTQLQYTLANILDVRPGRYTHAAWSLHIYDRDHAKIHGVTPPATYRDNYPRGLGRYPDQLLSVTSMARRIWYDDSPMVEDLLTLSERWYRDVLHPSGSDEGPAELEGNPTGDGAGARSAEPV